jgi:RNA polymerase sigma-70 factor (ECF subfamily)
MADSLWGDDELITGCRLGDRKAQRRVYELYYGKMKAVCLRYSRNVELAEDLVQDGFMKVFTSIERYDGKGSFEGWIRRIMVNLAIDQFRKQKHDFVLLGENQEIEDFLESAEEEDDNTPAYDFKPEVIMAAMQKLSPAYRTIFNLYVFENMSHKDIAEALNISIGTSKSNLAKARKNLKQLLLKDFYRADG